MSVTSHVQRFQDPSHFIVILVQICSGIRNKSAPESQRDLVLEDDFFGETRVGIDLFFGEQNIAPILFAKSLQLRIKERRLAVSRI
jgi:hypothetical protein